MKPTLVFVVTLLCLRAHFLFAKVEHLPAERRHALEAAAHFRMLNSTSEVPAALIALCANRDGKMAEPGGKWEPSDAIDDPSLPSKRLIWAATDGAYYIVHYESGGIAHIYHVLVAHLSPNEQKPDFTWFANTQPLENPKAFADALATNKLDDDPRLFR